MKTKVLLILFVLFCSSLLSKVQSEAEQVQNLKARLIGNILSNKENIWRQALKVLRKLEDSEQRSILKKAFKKAVIEGKHTQSGLVLAFRKSANAEDILLEILTNGPNSQKRVAAWLLSQLHTAASKSKKVAKVLSLLIVNKDNSVRHWVLKALGQTGANGSVAISELRKVLDKFVDKGCPNCKESPVGFDQCDYEPFVGTLEALGTEDAKKLYKDYRKKLPQCGH